MAKILRSTFRYPATENASVQMVPEGETQPVTFRSFSAKFNLVYDPAIGATRPPVSLEEQEALGIRSTTSYSSSRYFAGLALNDIIVHDGVFKKLAGVEVSFVNGGREGLLLIDPRKFDVGVADDVKITAMKSNTYSPWLYYGSIPERAKLVYNDNRQIASSGAIYPLEDIEVIQAVGFRYYVDVFLSNLFSTTIIPFVSSAAASTPVYSSSSSIGTAFFVADVIDGDGAIGYRTATNFKLLSIGSTQDILGNAVENFNTLRADAFRTLNYKQLGYKSNTYKINEFIIENDFYIVADPEKEVVEYMNLIGESFELVDKFVDFSTVRLSVDSGALSSDPTQIKQTFENLVVSEKTAISESISRLQEVIKNNIDNNPSETNNSIVAIIISDLITEVDDENSKQLLKDVVSSFRTDEKLSEVTLKIQLFITDSKKSSKTIALANEIFGSQNVIKIDSFSALNLGWLSFVGLLAETSSINFTEDSLVTQQASVDVNTLRDGLLIAISPTGSSGTDYDKDGVISTIDSRLYELTTRYKPTQSFSVVDSFLSDVGSEMRFWRKVIPTGELYNFTGKIIGEPQKKVGGNLLMDVEVTWPQIPNPEDPDELIDDPDKPENNIIKVLVEFGAKTNLELIDSSDVVFQGRLFHPGYLVKTRINNIIKFGTSSDIGEISSWFRVFQTTARNILEFGKDPLTINEPLLVIRSNMIPTGESASNTSSVAVSPIFGSGGSNPGPESQFRLIEGAEEVDDYLNLFDDDRNLTAETPIDFNEKLPIFSPGSDVLLNSIEFEILIPKDSKPPSSENQGEDGLIANFEYEILYKPTGFPSDDSVLTKFFSVIAFNGYEEDDKIVYKFKYNPQNNQTFICQPTEQDKELPDTVSGSEGAQIPNPDKNREFNITFPYGTKNDGSDFVWTWNAADWEFSIRKNNTRLTDSSFEFKPDPTTGKFKLKTAMNLKEEVLVAEFVNISGNQRKLKKGSLVSIKLKSGPQDIDRPTFRNARMNFETFNKAERVEGHYSSTAQGDSYYLIAPTYGFVSLSGAGWTFNDVQDPGKATAGGAFGTRVTGDITGPILYIDAFAKDVSSKTISKVGGIPYSFPYVDVIHSNLTNTFGNPFMETLSILFEPPPAPDVERITSFRSKVSNKITIVYNSKVESEKENILKQKYSFTNFNDRNTEGWEGVVDKSLRINIPVYSDFVTLSEKQFVSESDNSITFDVIDTDSTGAESGDKILVAIGLESSVPEEDIIPISSVKVYELYASIDGINYSPFGYSDSTGVQLPLRLIYDKNNLTQLPDTRGLNKIKIIPAYDSDMIDISKITVGYVDSITIGKSPTLFETSYGEYVLFFMRDLSNSPLRQIRALFSDHDGLEWKRPGVLPFIEVTTEDADGNDVTTRQRNPKLEESIIVLSGYNNPVILKDIVSDTFYIFVYNSRTVPGKIDMIEMTRDLFLKIEENNDSSATDTTAEIPDESQTSLINEDEVKSYARVFKQVSSNSFNHIKTVISNASATFSVAMTKQGGLYLSLIDSNGNFRIKYNRSSGSINLNTTFNWEDLGINLFDTATDNGDGTKGSALSKNVNSNDITATALSFSEIDETLYLFISTNSSQKLILVPIPESIIKPKGLKTVNNDNQTHKFLGEDKTDTQVDEYFQVQFNKTKPVLVYGKKEGLNSDFIEVRSGTNDNFPPQIVNIEWLENGEGHVYFVATNGRVQGRKTKTSGIFWEDLPNV